MGSLFWGEVILGICEGGKCRRLDVRRRLSEKIRRACAKSRKKRYILVIDLSSNFYI